MNIKLIGLNWTRVKLDNWIEFCSKLEDVICILANFIIMVVINY